MVGVTEPISDEEFEHVAWLQTAGALEKCHAAFRRWLGDAYDLDALNAVLAAAAVERMDGDPVWLLLVSGPGNAKTETVQALVGSGATITSTISSEGALLSATPAKERSAKATGGLLRQLGDRGVLVIKDVTSILSMSRESRSGVLAALREVYDGHWYRQVGTDGGRTLTWRGRLVVIGAVTTAWDSAHSVVSAMGDRFVLVRMDSTTGRLAAGRQSIGNTGSEEEMRGLLSLTVEDVLAQVAEGDGWPNLTGAETERLLVAADLVTLARTAVERDYRGVPLDAHAPEMPTRFAKQLAQLVRGGVVVGMDRTDALRLAVRCARDSMPPLRLAIVDDLAAQPHSTPTDVRRRINKPRSTVDNELQALHLLGVVDCDEVEYGDSGKSRWYYSLAAGIDPTALTVQSSQVVSVPTPSPQGREGEREGDPRAPTDTTCELPGLGHLPGTTGTTGTTGVSR